MTTKKTKDFTVNAADTAPVLETIATVTADAAPEQIARRSRKEEYTAEEIQLARKQGRTQGRKGVKAMRINFALDPDNYDYVHSMSQASGMSMTSFINYVLEKSRERNLELYEEAKEFKARII